MPAEASESVFYTTLQRRLHWLVILMISGQYLLQNPMREALLSIDRQETLGLGGFLVTTLHTWGGILIGAVMLWRWQLRTRTVPLNAGEMSESRVRWVTIHHWCLYAVILVMMLTGAMHYYLGWQVAARWHELGKWLLLGLIVIHIVGALTHVRSGNMVLQRMMGRDSLR